MTARDSEPADGLTALVPAGAGAVAVSAEGEVARLGRMQAAEKLRSGAVLVCHAGFTAARLGVKPPARRADPFDILELFAFVRPAEQCIPSPRGLARALALPLPETPEDEALTLLRAMQRLTAEPEQANYPYGDFLAPVLAALGRAGWNWARLLPTPPATISPGFDVWTRLPEWSERGSRSPRGTADLGAPRVAASLRAVLGPERSPRAGQADYALAVAQAFASGKETALVLAEAGTGIGKTLGYLAPALLWAEETGGPVWISTYTRNLQRQLDAELARLFPDAAQRNRHVAVRKGRENYLCLLNFQEAAGIAALGGRGADPVTLGLIARWLRYSRDGDMVGGDFPAWLGHAADGLTDRRGECLHAACPHYRKCPIERAARRARTARVVIANHAFVLTRAARDLQLPPEPHDGESAGLRGADPSAPERGRCAEARAGAAAQAGELPAHLIFDEGHHLFDAADAAFSRHLTGTELSDLRRWVRGPEARGRLRLRGLAERIGDLADDLPDGPELIRKALAAAARLPGPGWPARLRDDIPAGPCEAFLAALRAHVLRRAQAGGGAAQIEAEIHPCPDDLAGAGEVCGEALFALEQPLADLARGLRAAIDRADEPDAPPQEPSTLSRMEAAARVLERRALVDLAGWRRMLEDLRAGAPDEFVDWATLDYAFGRLADAGLHRHYVDPMAPLSACVYAPAKGVVVTSATLRDVPDEPDTDDVEVWREAASRLGAQGFGRPPVTIAVPSPFDYAAMTRVFVITDLTHDDAEEVARALADLFIASGGGAVGLFTAIRRLRSVWKPLSALLAEAGLPLYAQHVDAPDTGTLVDLFREETNSCLLGTDAVRDGVDVQGASLRLLALDRVPWPRPDILHKARRARMNRALDDRITRLRLRQAYGRLIRHEADRGVFVILDRRTPSRLLGSLPPGVTPARLPLAEAVAETRAFLRSEERKARK